MKKIAILALLLLFTPFLHGQAVYARADFNLSNAQGQAISGAQVYILTQPANSQTLTPLATIYSGSDGSSTPVTNPVNTDGFGHAFVYAAPGIYTVVFVSPFIGKLVYQDQNFILGGNNGIAASAQYQIPCYGSGGVSIQGGCGVSTDATGAVHATGGFKGNADTATTASSVIGNGAGTWTGPVIGHASADVAVSPSADQNVIQPGTSSLNVSALNRVVNASTYPGADCGAKINAAVAAWGTTPVTFEVNTNCGTSAWSNITLQPGQNIHFVESGTYTVGAITLTGGNMIYGSSMNNTILQPVSGTMSCILCIAGTSSSNVFFFFVRDLTFFNPATTKTGSSAIQTNFTQFIYINNVRFLNFDNNVNINNTVYLYVQHSYFNGGVSSNFKMDCCGPFYLDHNVFGASTAGPGINLLDAASGKISNNDITQNQTYGILVSATQPLPGGGIGDIEIMDNTIDSNNDSAILMNNTFESIVTGNWIASGRSVPGGHAGMQLTNSANISITANKCYGSGTDCFDLSGATSVTMTGNVMGGTSGNGINIAATVKSSFSGNSCNGTIYQGFGAGMSWCIFEQPSSSGNTFVGNSANSMISGDFSITSLSSGFNNNGNVIALGGVNTVFRCTAAGALPVGALTTTSGSCGTSVDAHIRVQ
jgi:hypothetical protein